MCPFNLKLNVKGSCIFEDNILLGQEATQNELWKKKMVPDRDPFRLVLLLLRLKGELDEELLQFLVAVVDAKLFKAADRGNN